MLRIISALTHELTLALERDLLRRADLHLVTVTSIDELRAAAQDGAQLCLVGPLLPDGDARDALEALRSSPALARVPVVLVATSDERQEIGDVDFAAVIELPYAGAAFDEMLGALLDAPRRRELRRAVSARVFDAGGVVIGRAVDLARSGIALRTRLAFSEGIELAFAIEFPGRPIPEPARGRVVRARGDRVALALLEPSPTLSAAMEETLEPLSLTTGLSFRPVPTLGPRGSAIGGALVDGPARTALIAHCNEPKPAPVRLLVRELHRFDEAGLDRWISLIAELGATTPVELHGLPAWLGELAARMPAVLGRGRATVSSLGVLLYCPACSDEYEDEATIDADDRAGKLAAVEALAQRPCAICGGPVQLTQPVDATLAFLVP